MRQLIREFVRIVVGTLPIHEPIYEFGALQPPGQEEFADMRNFFPGKEYIGCDMQEGPGVDKVLNLHDIDLPSETAGCGLILDTLEHVEFVRRAVEEAYRILKPEGILVISSQMDCPIHAYPDDYWRFTPSAFKSLLKPFKSSFVNLAGDEWLPHTVVGIGFKGSVEKIQLDDFKKKFEDWQKQWHEITGKFGVAFARQAAPAILWRLYRRRKWLKQKSQGDFAQ
jgi:hypothetical protein